MSDAAQKFNLTQQGYDELTQELAKIKNEKLPNAIDRVALARNHGDLAENSEYHSAREDLAFIEGRFEELEALIARATIVKPTTKNTIEVGSKVTVSANGESHTYHIVGEYEADPMQKKISHSSPLGKALTGKKVGEEVEFEAPIGKVVYKIDKIH